MEELEIHNVSVVFVHLGMTGRCLLIFLDSLVRCALRRRHIVLCLY